jgi:predicted transposase/invertase (TIGR01784 family)
MKKGEMIGIEKGIEKGRKETAKNMLEMGLDIKMICKATGLSEKEVENIRDHRKKMEA